jgi:predicted amidohydrolase
MTKFAAIQITSTADFQANLEKAENLIGKAAGQGAKVISLPETAFFVGKVDREFKYKQALDGELLTRLGSLAKEFGIYLVPGSFHETVTGSTKFFNTSPLFSPEGKLLYYYRKIHLFDANLPGPEKYRESDNFSPGDKEQLKVIVTPYGKFGLTICYDLRFPELYRSLVLAGAEIIFVPSAFTMHTGKDHWEVLLRARAIENQVYIVAPGQFGFHNEKRESYGNSMIIDPWGKVIARASDREEIIYADIDLDYLGKIRQKLPSLTHMRLL